MAVSKGEIQVQWSLSDSVSVTAGGNQTSDEFSLSATSFQARAMLKADNSNGSPAADDIIHFWLLESMGDPDGASTAEFTTTGHAHYLGAVDTNTEDPGIMAADIPAAASAGKIYAEGATEGSTNAITVSVTIYEVKG